MSAMKFILRIIGIAILLLIFGATYTFVTGLNKNDGAFDSNTKTIGALGGFHFLADIDYEDTTDYWRIALKTTMNRVSPLENDINTPYVKVQLKEISEPVLFGEGEKTIPELGSHYLLVDLSDVRTFDLNGETPEYVFVGEERQLINQDNINEVRLHQPPDDSSYQVLIGVDGPAKFRLKENEEDTGIVWLDILK